MSLDYQKGTYSHKRQTKHNTKRTSYEQMNIWQGVVHPADSGIDKYDLLDRENFPSHLNYSTSAGYDDNHRSYLKLEKDSGMCQGFPVYGPPRLRNGKTGGSWRHVTEVLQAGGSRRVFIDGRPGLADMTLVRGQEIPGCNTIHKVAPPAKPYSQNRFKVKETFPTQRGSHELEAFKSTENGNWQIMR